MDDVRTTRAVPAWYWIIAMLAVLWEGFGCYVYLSQTLMPEASREAGYATMAKWQWGVFAIAVWSGLIGAIGLLLRKGWAFVALLVSLAFAAIQYGYEAATDGIPADAIPIAISVIIVGLLLVAFANHAKKRGWIS